MRKDGGFVDRGDIRKECEWMERIVGQRVGDNGWGKKISDI